MSGNLLRYACERQFVTRCMAWQHLVNPLPRTSCYAASRRMSKRTGTPVFMAPEIFARDYSEKADVWSVGVMLYW